VLVPAYTGRARENVKITDDLITTEIPALAAALGRPPIIMTLELRRINGQMLVPQQRDRDDDAHGAHHASCHHATGPGTGLTHSPRSSGDLPAGWCLVGGQMVWLLAAEQGATPD